jgi:acetyltransferase-like isoleucine patch superfamily enzyme
MIRTAYVLQTRKRIQPFNDAVGEILIQEKPLRARQEEALAETGFAAHFIATREEIARTDLPCVVLTDDLYFTADALRTFLRHSEEVSGSTQCAIDASAAFAKSLLPFHTRIEGRIDFPLFYLRDLGDSYQPVVIDMKELKVPVVIPAHMRRGADIEISLSCRPLVCISHPTDILAANFAQLHVRFAKAFSSTFHKVKLMLLARSKKVPYLLAKMNKIGPGCDIHPTAWIEGAEIGANVTIGAYSVIRMSHIGDGCAIGDGSVIKHSVVGANSVIFDDLTLGFAVTYPETFLIHGPYHLSVFGRESAMFATILDDYRLDGKPIRLDVDGKLVPHPFPFVGSFIGHRTRVGGGSIISPGRILPNDLLVFPAAGSVLTYLDPNLPKNEPLFIEDGWLRPLAHQCARTAKTSMRGA